MKKQIVITIILLLATAFVTVYYFKNLNTPVMRANKALGLIPDNTSLIFEFNNDAGFYDVFSGNKLLPSIVGQEKIDELGILKKQLLLNPILQPYFAGQDVYISIHPSKTNTIDFLLTIAAGNEFEPATMDKLAAQPKSGLIVNPLNTNGEEKGFTIYVSQLKKRFYLLVRAGNVFSGSFSKELIDACFDYKNYRHNPPFVLLSAQQDADSPANLYVNYSQITPLFDQLFENKNTDIFKSFRLLPGLATLSLNYKTDALMFNGSTEIQEHRSTSYLSLFAGQHPVDNHLKDIFPSTTAYSTNFAVSDPVKFGVNLANWYNRAGLKGEEDQLFNKITALTGTNVQSEFYNLMGDEFAIVTTRYFEKFALISVKDGSRLKALMPNLGKMKDENSGQLTYEKLPFFLLGDAFSIFRRPYYMIIDNYLILTNSPGELASYYDTYIKRKYLNKNGQYNQFDNLLAARSNVSFLFNFKNAEPILKRDLKPPVYQSFAADTPGWANFSAASWQFTAADKNFYTNFCMRLNTDTASQKK